MRRSAAAHAFRSATIFCSAATPSTTLLMNYAEWRTITKRGWRYQIVCRRRSIASASSSDSLRVWLPPSIEMPPAAAVSKKITAS